MKRLFIILMCFVLLAGCTDADASSRKSVTVNYPKDTTVNGYRIPSKESTNEPINTSSKENSTDVSSNATSSAPQVNIQYCANIKSRVFHMPDCSSVSTMKEENKLFLSDRDALIADGYKPCGKCNP